METSQKVAKELAAKKLAAKKAAAAEEAAAAEAVETNEEFDVDTQSFEYTEGDFTYKVSLKNVEVDLVESEFGKTQIMINTEVNTEWSTDSHSALSSIFDGANSGKHPTKNYIAYRTVNEKTTVEMAREAVKELNLVAIKVTSKFPILTTSVKASMSKYDRSIEEIAEAQLIPNTGIYSIGIVSKFDSVAEAFIDTFKISEEELMDLLVTGKVTKINPIKIQIGECNLVATDFEDEDIAPKKEVKKLHAIF